MSLELLGPQTDSENLFELMQLPLGSRSTFTLWSFHIAMEHGPFIDDLRIYHTYIHVYIYYIHMCIYRIYLDCTSLTW